MNETLLGGCFECCRQHVLLDVRVRYYQVGRVAAQLWLSCFRCYGRKSVLASVATRSGYVHHKDRW